MQPFETISKNIITFLSQNTEGTIFALLPAMFIIFKEILTVGTKGNENITRLPFFKELAHLLRAFIYLIIFVIISFFTLFFLSLFIENITTNRKILLTIGFSNYILFLLVFLSLVINAIKKSNKVEPKRGIKSSMDLHEILLQVRRRINKLINQYKVSSWVFSKLKSLKYLLKIWTLFSNVLSKILKRREIFILVSMYTLANFSLHALLAQNTLEKANKTQNFYFVLIILLVNTTLTWFISKDISKVSKVVFSYIENGQLEKETCDYVIRGKDYYEFIVIDEKEYTREITRLPVDSVTKIKMFGGI